MACDERMIIAKSPMTYQIFISSVQREFAKERKALAEYIRSLEVP